MAPPLGSTSEKAKSSTHSPISISITETFDKEVGRDLHDLIMHSVPKATKNALSSSSSERERCRKTPLSISIPKSESDCKKLNLQSPRRPSSTVTPPLDTGLAAWRTLTVAVTGDAILFGFLFSYGVFQDYYYHKYQKNSPWIGLLVTSIGFMGSPAITYTCQHTNIPHHYFMWIGFALCILGLTLSAFCSSLPTLIVTQGVIYGFGIMFYETPSLLILNTWFNKRRGLAYGLVFAGCDLVGFAWSFLATYLLRNCSFRASMLIQAAIILVVGLPAVFLLRARYVPPSIASEARHRDSIVSPVTLSATPVLSTSSFVSIPAGTERRYFHRSIFYIFMASNLLVGLAYYLPFFYLPSFVTSLGYSPSQAALVLAIANLAQVFGELGFGKLSDKVGVNVLVICSTLPAALSALLLWGFARTVPLLLAFALLFGTFGSGFVALYARMGMIFGEKDAPMVYSALYFGRGISSLISGPISEGLFTLTSRTTKDPVSYGGKPGFNGLVLFVGSCMVGAALCAIAGIIALRWKLPEKRRDARMDENA